MTSLLLLAVLAAEPVNAAPLLPPLPSAFFKSVSEAGGVLELEVPLISSQNSTARWVNGVKQVKVLGLLVTRSPMDAPDALELKPWDVMRSCLHRMDGRKSVKVLLLMTGSPARPTVFPQSSFGFGLESTPGYEQLKAALVESFTWHEERMRAVGAEQLWLSERKAVISENPYLRHLAAEFLVLHDASDVVDAAWGPRGSPEREKNEAAAKVVPDCRG